MKTTKKRLKLSERIMFALALVYIAILPIKFILLISFTGVAVYDGLDYFQKIILSPFLIGAIAGYFWTKCLT